MQAELTREVQIELLKLAIVEAKKQKDSTKYYELLKELEILNSEEVE